MISILQIALGGLAPPILAVHVALAGLAPIEQPADLPIHVGPRGSPYRILIPPSIRNEDEEILLLIFAALQVLDIN